MAPPPLELELLGPGCEAGGDGAGAGGGGVVAAGGELWDCCPDPWTPSAAALAGAASAGAAEEEVVRDRWRALVPG